jgi:hypothetical protein
MSASETGEENEADEKRSMCVTSPSHPQEKIDPDEVLHIFLIMPLQSNPVGLLFSAIKNTRTYFFIHTTSDVYSREQL